MTDVEHGQSTIERQPNIEPEKKIEQDEQDPVKAASAPPRPWFLLPAIVFSQFAGTSLWFAGNAVLPDLVDEWGLAESSLSYLTSTVQFGFIVGTLFFALLNIADRFSPAKVFFYCTLLGATCNALIPFWKESIGGLLFFRFCTGVCLAGVYPVGMKIASDWFQAGLGNALGWLVGALALGSSFPFLLVQIPQPWEALLWESSALALTGGLVINFFVPDGPFRKPAAKFDPTVVWTLFENKSFRAAAVAYFGHMWELYAFWAWLPEVWEAYLEDRDVSTDTWNPSVVTFLVIAMGGLGCVVGGYVSNLCGSAWVAFVALAVSGALCALSPLLYLSPLGLALPAYLVWGMAVLADSPQFSTLVAQTSPAQNKGTALTIVNCIGFATTIGSIQLLAVPVSEQYLFLLLAPGPIIGIWSLRVNINPSNMPSQEKATADD